jgi:hypothetical protein
MSEAEIRNAVREAVGRFVKSFTDGEDLLARGAIKSLDVLELVDFVCDVFAIAVTPADLFAGRLNSIDGMVALVLERVKVRS